MADEHQIPAFVFRIAYDIIQDETPNRAVLLRILELAELERFADCPPPMDSSPAITRREYEKLIGIVWQVFDQIQARAIFRRAGQLGFEHLARSGVLSFTQFLRAFDSLAPRPDRVALAIQRLARELSIAIGNRHEFHRDGDDYILDLYDCPYCAELLFRSSFTPEARVCHIPVAFYEAAINWASGGKHTVREIACRVASGGEFCRFKIFWNVGVTAALG